MTPPLRHDPRSDCLSSEYLVEDAGYFDFAGAHIYAVLHKTERPRARVLLVGPFASERSFSYIPWVRWARFLAARHIEVLRFDYRGVGESTGSFEDMAFEDWRDDVAFLASWLKRRSPDLPLMLHGLEMGALLASNIFENDVGEALLLWGTPPTANDVLRPALLRRIAADRDVKDRDQRKQLSDYVRLLEANEPVDIDGYRVSGRLWRESFTVRLPFGKDDEANAFWASGRPVKADHSAASLVKGSWLAVRTLNPDLSRLFAANFEWIATVLTAREGIQA